MAVTGLTVCASMLRQLHAQQFCIILHFLFSDFITHLHGELCRSLYWYSHFVRPSVCLSVTLWLCIRKHITEIFSQPDNLIILVSILI